MRNVARLKMGYYPLPESEACKLRTLLSFAGPASVIDPCVGQGTSLHLVSSDAPVRRYGTGTDAVRHPHDRTGDDGEEAQEASALADSQSREFTAFPL
jgi:hypothetical protein